MTKNGCPVYGPDEAPRYLEVVDQLLLQVEVGSRKRQPQVSIRWLMSVHALTHPSAKLDRPPRAEAPGNGASHARSEGVP